MPILSNSWMNHYNALASNDKGNKNLQAFASAMLASKSKEARIAELTQDPNTIFYIAGPDRTIATLHSPTSFEGTKARATKKIAALTGMGLKAIGIKLKEDAITKISSYQTPK